VRRRFGIGSQPGTRISCPQGIRCWNRLRRALARIGSDPTPAAANISPTVFVSGINPLRNLAL
jgi:hypothetical protein